MRSLLTLLLILTINVLTNPSAVLGQGSWVNVTLQSDQYGVETSWGIISNSNGEVVQSSPPIAGNTLTETIITLPSGLYTFVIYDSFGDGICCGFGEGWVSLTNTCGLDESIYDFNTDSASIPFTLGWCDLPISGCMDPIALNYNPWATTPSACEFIPTICPEGETNIMSLLAADTYFEEISWDISVYGTGEIIDSGGDYTGVQYTNVSSVCASEGDSLVATIYDTYGDGLCGSCWGGIDGHFIVLTLCNDIFFNIYGEEYDTLVSPVFVVPACDPPIYYGCTDPNYLEYNSFASEDNGTCLTPIVLGCIDSSAFNYDAAANVMEMGAECDYTLTLIDGGSDGWYGSWLGVTQGDSIYGPYEMFPVDAYALEIPLTLNSFEEVNVYFFTEGNAETTAGQCGFNLSGPQGIILEGGTNPWTDPLSKFPFKYTATPSCNSFCEPIVYGCMDAAAQNYVIEANTDDESCHYAAGCTQAGYLEYYTQGYEADFDNGSCETLAMFGCMDSTAFNYDALANVDNLGCLPVVEGCMNSLAFNYDPLANTDADCIPFIYGCTDPTAFNYNEEANTNDGECVEVILGCTDSIALNYNPLANTDNEGCILPIEGCMDAVAFNYNSEANVPILEDCLYDAGCVTGPGNPYWLNDSCYAWVINVDPYCCESVWDGGCVGLYDYCNAAWPTSIEEFDRRIVIRPNPTSDRIYIETDLSYTLSVYHPLGIIMIDRTTDKELDISNWANGAYHMILEANGIIYRKTIIKQ